MLWNRINIHKFWFRMRWIVMYKQTDRTFHCVASIESIAFFASPNLIIAEKSYFGNIELKMHDQNMDKIVRRQNDHKTLPTFLHSMEIFRQRFTPVHKIWNQAKDVHKNEWHKTTEREREKRCSNAEMTWFSSHHRRRRKAKSFEKFTTSHRLLLLKKFRWFSVSRCILNLCITTLKLCVLDVPFPECVYFIYFYVGP